MPTGDVKSAKGKKSTPNLVFSTTEFQFSTQIFLRKLGVGTLIRDLDVQFKYRASASSTEFYNTYQYIKQHARLSIRGDRWQHEVVQRLKPETKVEYSGTWAK
jgi:hypothetical protein